MTHAFAQNRSCLKCGDAMLTEDAARRLWDCESCGATHEDRYGDGKLMLHACETCGASLRDITAMQHVVHDVNANPQSRVVKTCEGCHPPQVGEYVRWDAADRSIWAAGVLVSLGTQAARIRVESGPEGWTYTVDAESAASFRIGSGETLRGIPRPTAGERLAQEFAEFQEVPDDALHIDEAHTMEFGKRLAAAAASAIAERDPLIDGLTLGECRGRWFANRARLEPAMCAGMRSPGRIVPPLEPLTPAQIAAVKAEVASDVQTWWPRQLREMVDASAAIDKARAVNVVCDSGEADE